VVQAASIGRRILAPPPPHAVHMVCDNYATHKTETVERWLLAHPRFQLHDTHKQQ
jgi:hypothetical protein